MRRALLLLGCLASLGLGVGGCAGYRLGSGVTQIAGDKSVQVAPFSNQTLEPALGDAVSAAMRKLIQRGDTYRLATQDDGDIIVRGEILRYERTALSYQPTDVLTPLDVRVNILAHVKATERATGKVIFDRDVSGYTLIRVGSDLTSAERQGLPLLAENLAKNITALLENSSW
jgi:hypothetical protein